VTTDIPATWKWATVGDAADVTGGLTKNAGKRDASKVRVPLVSVAAVHLRRIDPGAVGEVGLLDSDGDRATLAKGDLLIVEGNGSLEHIGRVALWDDEVPGARHQNHIIRVRPRTLSSRFVLEWLASPAGREAIVNEATSAAGLYTLSLSKVERLPLPVPPANEQRRIVAKLEALQARSRRAREALDAVPPLLEKLRQSILAAAFRGALTKDWRAEHKDVEPATKLLERIRAERRKKWEEAELAKIMAKGKAPTDDAWKAKYKEPVPVETTGLPELPEGWAWASTSELSVVVVDCPHSTPSYGSGGFFAIDTTCILPGEVVVARLRQVAHETYVQRTARLVPAEGDVVFAREGTVGTAVSLPKEPPVCLGQRVMLLRPASALARRWLERSLMSPPVTAQYRRQLVGSTVPHLNVSDVVRLACPVPPKAEQEEILERILSWERIMGSIRSSVANASASERALAGAVLAKAFRGDLVPQDPDDEPAEVMLTRTRVTKSVATNGTPAIVRGLAGSSRTPPEDVA
jgi:type I restriction enzyme, S subunit